MKIDLNEHEQSAIVNALELAEKSAKRAQTGKSPQISAVYAAEENQIRSLKLKIQTTK